jgi:hypothetical protein
LLIFEGAVVRGVLIGSGRRIIERSERQLHLLSDSILSSNLHSPERQLIELRIEHADLDAMVDRLAQETPLDELMLQRLKKRRLALRDRLASLERALEPKEPA